MISNQHPWSRTSIARLVIINLTSFLIGAFLSLDAGTHSGVIHHDNLSLAFGTKMIISFSLYGNDTLYTTGAIRNAEQVPALYPGWISRFYIDQSVPDDIIQRLGIIGAEIVRVDHEDKPWMVNRLWRYLALDDPDVKLVIFRDCDTRITTRELEAVNTWLESGYRHHIMRDHPDQNQLVVAGQWSASAQSIRSRISSRLTAEFISAKYSNLNDASVEDMWLTIFIWPIVRSNVLVHDTFNCDLFESEVKPLPFPGPREWHGDYVGRTVVERFDKDSDYFINGQREFFGEIVAEPCRLSPEHVEG